MTEKTEKMEIDWAPIHTIDRDDFNYDEWTMERYIKAMSERDHETIKAYQLVCERKAIESMHRGLNQPCARSKFAGDDATAMTIIFLGLIASIVVVVAQILTNLGKQ